MANVSDFIAISISLVATAVQSPAFNTLLILGTNTPAVNSATAPNVYTSLSSVATDYPASTSEYKAAQAAFAQSPAPANIKIFKAAAIVAGVDTLTVGGTEHTGDVLSATINGVTSTYTVQAADTTLADVATNFAAQITADHAAIADLASAASGGTDVITVTGNLGYDLSITNAAVTGAGATTTLASAVTTTSNTLSDDLNALLLVDPAFYFVAITADLYSANNVYNLAGWIEPNKRLSIVQSSDYGILDSVTTTDVASRIKTYTRTRVFYHISTAISEYPDVALMANRSTYQPGSTLFGFVTLAGVTPDALTEAQIQTCRGVIGTSSGKGVFTYTTTASVAMTDQGVDPNFHWFDQTWGIDWLQATIQDDLLTLFAQASQAGRKVPYTDAGASLVSATIYKSLDKGITAGVLANDGSAKVTIPTVASQSATNQTMRYFSGITFAANLAGAIQGTAIQGTLVA